MLSEIAPRRIPTAFRTPADPFKNMQLAKCIFQKGKRHSKYT